MRLRLLTITNKLPSWVKAGYNDFAKRLPPSYAVELLEIPAHKRNTNTTSKVSMAREAASLLAAVKSKHLIVALDQGGTVWSTDELSQHLKAWQNTGHNVDFLIGGADGLAENCLKQANHIWSLSRLTFPHALVRIIFIEQIYRAYSLLQNHPYHR